MATDIFYEFEGSQGIVTKAEVLEVVVTATGVRATLDNPESMYAGYVEGEGPDLESAIRDAGQKI